jgi:hypothetical protein
MTPTDPRHGPSARLPGPGELDRLHAQHGHTDHDGLYNEDVVHEYSDVEIRPLLIFSVGMVAIVAVVAFAMWGLFRVFESQAAQNEPVVSPVAYPSGRARPEPILLEDEPKNLRTIKAAERQVLDGYSWMNQQTGTARIPIDEAKKRLLQQGLPVRAGDAVEPWMGTYAASRGESSGGRAIAVRPGGTGTEPPAQPAAPPAHQPAAPKSGGH